MRWDASNAVGVEVDVRSWYYFLCNNSGVIQRITEKLVNIIAISFKIYICLPGKGTSVV